MHHTLFSDGSVFLQFQALFHSPITLIVVLLGSAIVMRSPVRWIPTEKDQDQSSKHFRDLFYWYFQVLHKIQGSLFRQNVLIQKDIKLLKEKRWLLSKEFFNYMFMSYEAFFYIGVFTGLISIIDHQALQIQLLFTLNIMILANQSYEMRMLTPSIFALSAEKRTFGFTSFLKYLFCNFSYQKSSYFIVYFPYQRSFYYSLIYLL